MKIASKLVLAASAALIAYGIAAPASAQPWGGPPPPPPPGWGGPPPPHPGWGRPHRRHCWWEERRVKVWTDHGPRWRVRSVKVCD